MPEQLAPKLKQISVKYNRFVLDPNNPRFTTREEDRVREEHYLDQDLTGATLSKMRPEQKDRYKIAELVSSIKQNGWLPVDYIFVRRLRGEDNRYVVLEGNRRVAAIREIMKDSTSDTTLKKSLESIDVMEVLDSGSSEELQEQITYLLGVRHHGSLRRWTPFAQAHNIFERYLEVSHQIPESFEWNEQYAKEVADTLSIPNEEVRDRLRVYQVMVQVGNSADVKKSEKSGGGMVDRYYSICAEPLLSPRKKLGAYISQDPKTFLLNEEGVARMIKLCHFDEPDRKGAPLSNPPEWRYLDKILGDEDLEKRADMLRQVEEQRSHPSEVWAIRAKEMTKYTWERWLLELTSILNTVTLDDLKDTRGAIPTVEKLLGLVDQLDQRDIH
jgi:ParB/Sulfiredoxin domain